MSVRRAAQALSGGHSVVGRSGENRTCFLPRVFLQTDQYEIIRDTSRCQSGGQGVANIAQCQSCNNGEADIQVVLPQNPFEISRKMRIFVMGRIVVMGRQTFKYTAIQRKISLSLSNLLSFASKFLCKSRKMRRRKNFRL